LSKRKRSIGSVRAELVAKAREAAVAAVRTFNDPGTRFKSETFIVLMIIAWTYLLHAYYRSKRVDYRYFKPGPKRKRYDRTKRGAYKYWELERCLSEPQCPIDQDAANNLRLLIGLRHEIEHQMTRSLDGYLSGRYQACALNFNHYLKHLFGKKHGLDQELSYSIQFLQLLSEQLEGASSGDVDIPTRLKAYITEFDGNLTHEQYNSERYSYRLLFKRKLVNRPGQADKVVEFIDPKSDLAKQIDKEYWVKKEVEKPKFRAKDVVASVRRAGFPRFAMFPDHLNMWRSEDAKNPGKGYGCDVQGSWFWYQSWIDRCLELCEGAGPAFRGGASA
jgi:hypothetical protein